MKIKILSYNIHKGFTIGNTDFVLEEMKAAIHETGADIVFLQEVLGDHTDPKCRIPEWKTAAQFEFMADSLWPHYSYGKNAVYPEGHHGNAILSKFPIRRFTNYDLSTNRFEYRGLLKSTLFLPEINKEIIVANTHLDLTQWGRNRQVSKIISVMKEEDHLPWMLVGDFNDWNKKITPRVEKELEVGEVFHQMYGKTPLTFPSFMPLLSLDRIFVKRMKPTLAQSLSHSHWRNLSDHLPLYVEIVIDED